MLSEVPSLSGLEHGVRRSFYLQSQKQYNNNVKFHPGQRQVAVSIAAVYERPGHSRTRMHRRGARPRRLDHYGPADSHLWRRVSQDSLSPPAPRAARSSLPPGGVKGDYLSARSPNSSVIARSSLTG